MSWSVAKHVNVRINWTHTLMPYLLCWWKVFNVQELGNCVRLSERLVTKLGEQQIRERGKFTDFWHSKFNFQHSNSK